MGRNEHPTSHLSVLRNQLDGYYESMNGNGPDAEQDEEAVMSRLVGRIERLESSDPATRSQACEDEVLGRAFWDDPSKLIDSQTTRRWRASARRLIDSLGPDAVLALDDRSLRRGLNPTNYDDRVMSEPVPHWVFELEASPDYDGALARFVIASTEPAKPGSGPSTDGIVDSRELAFMRLQDLRSEYPEVRRRAEESEFLELVCGDEPWRIADRPLRGLARQHLDTVGLSSAMGHEQSPAGRAVEARIRELDAGEKDYEVGMYVADLRRNLYQRQLLLAHLDAYVPTGFDLDYRNDLAFKADGLQAAIAELVDPDPRSRARAQEDVVVGLLMEARGVRLWSTPKPLRAEVRAFIDVRGGFDSTMTRTARIPAAFAAHRRAGDLDDNSTGWNSSFAPPTTSTLRFER